MEKKTDYNAEPVFYCKHCLSLNIIDYSFIDCCADCGSTDIGKASLEEYDNLMYVKFGRKLFYPDK